MRCLLLVLTATAGASEPNESSAPDLLRYLTYQAGRPGRDARQAFFECGEDVAAARDDRRAANSLVALGAAAIPDIEKALDSMEKRGLQSPFIFNGSWLLIAYAKISGVAAYPRLVRMIGNPGLRQDEYSLDASVAISLGLTSYVDRFGKYYGVGIACSTKEPRDALDRMILAWENNDGPSLEAGLGPQAKVALRSLLKGRSWAEMRAGLWHGQEGGSVAMGYRFETSGPWAEPVENLDDALAMARTVVNLESLPRDPLLDTLLRTRAGRDCGRQQVKFLTSQDTFMHRLMYLVDNPDLGNLLRSISACATGGAYGR